MSNTTFVPEVVTMIIAANKSSEPDENVTDTDFCTGPLPTAQEMWTHLMIPGKVVIGLCIVFTLITVALFVEMVIFTTVKNKRFFIPLSACLYAIYPVYSITCLMTILIPRSTVVADLTAETFLGYILYKFLQLGLVYFGGGRKMLQQIGGKEFTWRSPPCCCCCPLPKGVFNRKSFTIISNLILQVAMLRPLLMFIAAILWTNGNYTPGLIAADNAYIYINVANVASTLFAMYGLMLLLQITDEALKDHNMKAKVTCVQIVLISTGLFNLLCNILVSVGSIPCVPPLSAKSRGERLYHILLIVEMMILAIVARKYFREIVPEVPSFMSVDEESSLSINNSINNSKKDIDVIVEQPLSDMNGKDDEKEELNPKV